MTVPIISVDTSLAPPAPDSEIHSITPTSPNSLRPDATHLSVYPLPWSPASSIHSRSHSIGGSTIHPLLDKRALEEDDDNPFTPDPGQEAAFDVENNPFAFTRGHMSKFFHPKSLRAYYASGGIDGLEKGLQTNLVTGLNDREEHITSKISFGEATLHIPKGHDAFRKDSSVSSASTLVPPTAAFTKGGPAPTLFPITREKSIPDHDAEKLASLPPPAHPFADRIRIFDVNQLPKKKGKTIFDLMWEAYKDPFILVLTGAAVISLALGIYETIRAQKHEPNGPTPVDWVEGVAIVVAIVIVVVVTAGNDWQKERQFNKLNRKKEDRSIQVIRSGKVREISIYDLLVGDVVCINQGDLIPADGIVIESNEVKCDESSATGESDQMKKTSGKEVYDRIVANGGSIGGLDKLDPFIISGAKVLEGTGKYLVTAVGVNSSYGKIMMSLRHESDKTPLQEKLERFAGGITKFGLGSAVLLLLVLTFKFIGGLPGNTDSASAKASTFLDILIVAVTIIVVAVPEGLPLAVTLALAYATTRMLKDNNLVRVLRACETMGNATTVCSDKTGTLTQNKMTVVTGIVGRKSTFAEVEIEEDKVGQIATVFQLFSEQTKELFRASVVLNSTATDGESSGQFNGSKTETALLSLIGDYIGIPGPLSKVRANYSVQQIFPFDSARKCMGIVAATPSGYRLYVKGASEILLAKCARYIEDAMEQSRDGIHSTTLITSEDRAYFENTITSYARRSLRTIALVYKDFPQWPPANVPILEESKDALIPKVSLDDIFSDMTLFGIVGIQDPLRPGVPEAVQQCHLAGVTVRMVTGDNIETAKAIAKECGIYDESSAAGHIVMEGPAFRKLSKEEMSTVVRNLRVLARSSPEDKRILVRALKDQDQIVAVTGDGTNDGPALKMADVGFSMGIAGTEVAKEASSIILMDDNFSSIVKALMWGRAVNDAVQKFLQFQLTVNITAVVLTFVSAVASKDMKSVLTAVQLLWVNLIMDTFAALALATDAPTPSILKRLPTSRKAGLVSLRMWKMIIGQAILQLAVTFMLHFGGAKMFGYTTEHEHLQLRTMVFNTFVWMQIFNEFNNRRLDNGLNIFEGIHRNYFFIGINAIMFAGQVAIIFVGGRAFGITPITAVQWAICIGLAFISMPWAVAIRCIPDAWAEAVWLAVGKPVADVLSMGWHGCGKVLRIIVGRRKKAKDAEAEAGEEEEEKR
ncbi:plasma membrane calcium-transporting ATPase 2 [Kalaharituber pfeilii]|nr:plasma membrane calcium-transporting ATPase 2 [Kalaharituber pfeilii]